MAEDDGRGGWQRKRKEKNGKGGERRWKRMLEVKEIHREESGKEKKEKQKEVIREREDIYEKENIPEEAVGEG